MVPCIEKFQHVLTTPGDPTSELLARIFKDDLTAACREQNINARVKQLRVWESPNCYAEIAE
jgi:6-pyruvoyltetrahydropterin/6-carboxytetrahydropterin synthase